MSIYPKRVIIGENLIIHLRFNNIGKKVEYIKFHLHIENPKQEIIFSKDDYKLLGINDNSYIYETYQSIPILNNFLYGKYKVVFNITTKGIVISSDTENSDYFYVDGFSFYKTKDKIVIKNLSIEDTPCRIFSNEKEKELVFNSLEEKILPNNYKYLEYGNHNVFYISNKDKKYYIKNPNISIKNNVIYNLDIKETISL